VGQVLGGADTGELQDVRRADGTRRQDHIAVGLGALDVIRPWAAAFEFDTNCALAVEQDAAHQRLVTTCMRFIVAPG
jgi:hypothetical protein